jgi:hypothetical protein
MSRMHSPEGAVAAQTAARPTRGRSTSHPPSVHRTAVLAFRIEVAEKEPLLTACLAHAFAGHAYLLPRRRSRLRPGLPLPRTVPRLRADAMSFRVAASLLS